MTNEWFAEWFDSPYYHILYHHRDEQEAKAALDSLLSALQLPAGARILDLACGKGRHSRYLAEQGFDVTGLDISDASISFARQFEHAHLHFYRHDMRLPYRHNYFDAVMNMFTSFGYFDNDRDHLRSLRNVALGLKQGGVLLLDFFNSEYVRRRLVPSDTKVIDQIAFRMTRHADARYVHKTVDFEHEGLAYHFEESVRLFTEADFRHLLEAAGLELRQTFGEYQLAPFDALQSPRLILIAVKP